MTWHIKDVPSSNAWYQIWVSTANPPGQVHSVSLGSSSPNKSETPCADDTGWKLGAFGSTGGDVLQTYEHQTDPRVVVSYEKIEENMVGC